MPPVAPRLLSRLALLGSLLLAAPAGAAPVLGARLIECGPVQPAALTLDEAGLSAWVLSESLEEGCAAQLELPLVGAVPVVEMDERGQLTRLQLTLPSEFDNGALLSTLWAPEPAAGDQLWLVAGQHQVGFEVRRRGDGELTLRRDRSVPAVGIGGPLFDGEGLLVGWLTEDQADQRRPRVRDVSAARERLGLPRRAAQPALLVSGSAEARASVIAELRAQGLGRWQFLEADYDERPDEHWAETARRQGALAALRLGPAQGVLLASGVSEGAPAGSGARTRERQARPLERLVFPPDGLAGAAALLRGEEAAGVGASEDRTRGLLGPLAGVPGPWAQRVQGDLRLSLGENEAAEAAFAEALSGTVGGLARSWLAERQALAQWDGLTPGEAPPAAQSLQAALDELPPADAHRRALLQLDMATVWLGWHGGEHQTSADHSVRLLADALPVLEGGPVAGAAWLRAGDALERMGKRAEAVEAYNQAIGLLPEDGLEAWADARLGLARVVLGQTSDDPHEQVRLASFALQSVLQRFQRLDPPRRWGADQEEHELPELADHHLPQLLRLAWARVLLPSERRVENLASARALLARAMPLAPAEGLERLRLLRDRGVIELLLAQRIARAGTTFEEESPAELAARAGLLLAEAASLLRAGEAPALVDALERERAVATRYREAWQLRQLAPTGGEADLLEGEAQMAEARLRGPLILSLSGEDRWSQALASFERAAARLPEDPRPLERQAHCLWILGATDEAVAAQQAALARAPQNEETRDMLSVYACVRTLNGCRDHAKSWAALGEVYARQGDIEASQDALERALNLYPTHPEAITQVVRSLVAAGNRAGAQERIDQALAASPESPRLLQLAARFAGEIQGDALTALELTERRVALVEEPEAGLLADLAEAQLLAGQPERARPLLRRLTRDPATPDVLRPALYLLQLLAGAPRAPALRQMVQAYHRLPDGSRVPWSWRAARHLVEQAEPRRQVALSGMLDALGARRSPASVEALRSQAGVPRWALTAPARQAPSGQASKPSR